MPSLSADLEFRGLVHQVSDPELLQLLDAGGVTAYIGFDPTGDSLHIGHLLQLFNLRRLQLAGNRPIVLAGGGTGLIGDPGGRDTERPLLSRDELRANLESISGQLERFLDFSAAAGATSARLLDNAAWLTTFSLVDFLRDVGKHFTVNQMVAKESVRQRIDRPEQGISFTEFSYMLLQACDFLHLFEAEGCRLQMGASDQWGNITMGIDLIRRVHNERAFALTTPLVLKPDGSKFGKSVSGALYLDATRTSPYEMYQYFVRAVDSVVGTYLRFFTFLDHETILELDEATRAHPERRDAPRRLADEVLTLVHGPAIAAQVERAADALYADDLGSLDEPTLLMALSDAPSSVLSMAVLDPPGLDLVETLVSSKLTASKQAARTALTQGGVYVNNRRADDTTVLSREHLLAGHYIVLRRGRRDLHLLNFS